MRRSSAVGVGSKGVMYHHLCEPPVPCKGHDRWRPSVPGRVGPSSAWPGAWGLTRSLCSVITWGQVKLEIAACLGFRGAKAERLHLETGGCLQGLLRAEPPLTQPCSPPQGRPDRRHRHGGRVPAPEQDRALQRPQGHQGCRHQEAVPEVLRLDLCLLPQTQ